MIFWLIFVAVPHLWASFHMINKRKIMKWHLLFMDWLICMRWWKPKIAFPPQISRSQWSFVPCFDRCCRLDDIVPCHLSTPSMPHVFGSWPKACAKCYCLNTIVAVPAAAVDMFFQKPPRKKRNGKKQMSWPLFFHIFIIFKFPPNLVFEMYNFCFPISSTPCTVDPRSQGTKVFRSSLFFLIRLNSN